MISDEYAESIGQVIKQMIQISDQELNSFRNLTSQKTFKRQDIISLPGRIPNEIYFIYKGLIRVLITDNEGNEHTIHFALENQFIADYSKFMQQKPAVYTLQSLENTQVIVIPRKAIEWGYEHLNEGQKLGRLIAESYFIYQDSRIENIYSKSPKQRFDCIEEVFPNLQNRVPQHMIASYLGITPVHLSRLKRENS